MPGDELRQRLALTLHPVGREFPVRIADGDAGDDALRFRDSGKPSDCLGEGDPLVFDTDSGRYAYYSERLRRYADLHGILPAVVPIIARITTIQTKPIQMKME